MATNLAVLGYSWRKKQSNAKQFFCRNNLRLRQTNTQTIWFNQYCLIKDLNVFLLQLTHSPTFLLLLFYIHLNVSPKIGPYCMRSITINHCSELSDRVDQIIIYHLCADTVCVVANCLNLMHHIHIHHISIIPLLLFSFYLFRKLLSPSIFIFIFYYYLSNFILVKLDIILNCIKKFIINIKICELFKLSLIDG